MKKLTAFDSFVNEEKYTSGTAQPSSLKTVDDIFGLWDYFFDDERKGIERSLNKEGEVVEFNFYGLELREVAEFRKKLAEKLLDSNLAIRFDKNKLTIIK